MGTNTTDEPTQIEHQLASAWAASISVCEADAARDEGGRMRDEVKHAAYVTTRDR